MSEHEHFRLTRKSDGLIYEFDRVDRSDGQAGYKRRDRDLWITFRLGLGWVGYDADHAEVTLRPWEMSPSQQHDQPPEGEWVSKKGVKSYVYELRYVERGDSAL